MANIKSWFPTLIHHAPLLRREAAAYNAELLREIGQLREFDRAGRQ